MVNSKHGNCRSTVINLILLASWMIQEGCSSSIGSIRHRKSRTNIPRAVTYNSALQYMGKFNEEEVDNTLLPIVSMESHRHGNLVKNVSVVLDEEIAADDYEGSSFIKTESQIDDIYKIKFERNKGIRTEKKDSSEEKLPFEVDIVTKFLRIVETQHLLGENCTAGTDLNLGEGVVDRYAQERFRVEADVAVNRANMLTRLWKYADPDVLNSEYLLHASVVGMVEFDDDIFAGGNCYDEYQYKDYWLFCPYAFRLPDGPILTKNLAIEYKYITNSSEWFFIARKSAERIIKNHDQLKKGNLSHLDSQLQCTPFTFVFSL
ncbi:hypothetical protein RUM44_011780 [Polyplax serrata]|uniref:Uncharacterized protein n=1 Tax=Polyplax serrata TaxID=468196 RepID=A0ABR1AR34_POLSC